MLNFLYGTTLTFTHDYWKNHSFDCMNICQQRQDIYVKYFIHLKLWWIRLLIHAHIFNCLYDETNWHLSYLCNIKAEYLQISENTVEILLCYPTTYLCEAEFSSYILIKTIYWQTNTKADRRFLSSLIGYIRQICKYVICLFYVIFYSLKK